MALSTPGFINFSIEPSFASCFVYDKLGGDFLFSSVVTRKEFNDAFTSTLNMPEKTMQLSYEPYSGIYSIVNMVSSKTVVQSFKPDSFPEVFKNIEGNTKSLYEWFYDQAKLQEPPSKFHEYDYVNHEWTITEQNGLLLLKDEIAKEVQVRLNEFAQTRGYDTMLSACTYATSTVTKFAEEGQYCVDARDATWNKLYEIMAKVEAGTRPVPSGYSDIEAELPVLEWPN